MKRLLIIPVIAALALLVGVGYAARGGGGEENERVSGVPSEGIDVHGDWKIAVYNQDGSLDEEYTFSNALGPAAGSLLGLLLAIDTPDFDGAPATATQWLVLIGELDAGTPGASPCDIPPNGVLGPIPDHDPALSRVCALVTGGTRSVPGQDAIVATPIEGGVRLAGSVQATRAGTVDFVETALRVRAPVPGGGLAAFLDLFTATGVGPFENIEVGQIIQVQVDITFQTPAP
jgi:hypothetical protein